MDSKDIPRKKERSSKGEFVEELIYENIDLMTQNIKQMIEIKELKDKIRNLEILYRIACFNNKAK